MGGYGDGTFNGTTIDKVMEQLEKNNFECNGNEVLYNGFTGKQLNTKIFMGPTYYQRLKHMVEDKIHLDAMVYGFTYKQPAEGRSRWWVYVWRDWNVIVCLRMEVFSS